MVPYRGTAPGLLDVAAGNVQLMIDPVLALLPPAQSGNVKAIALTSAKRSTLAPKRAHGGGKAACRASTLPPGYGVWGPKELPADLVKSLNAAVNEAVRGLAESGQLEKIGVEPATGSPKTFDDFQRAYQKKGAELLTAAKFEPS